MDKRVQVRTLRSLQVGDSRVLDALAWPTPFGTGFRLYLGAGHSDKIAAQQPDTRLHRAIRIGANTIVTGTAPAGATALELSIGGVACTVPVTAPETSVFDGLDVLLAVRLSETPEHVAAWLDELTRMVRPSALLLFDRAPAEAGFADGFSACLSRRADIGSLQRVCLVNAPLPLGLAGAPSQQDRAQGDPWRAPLAEPAFHDLMRWRFLALASTVLALDPTDLLEPLDEPVPVFETIRHAQTGYVPILGQAVYPWRIRKGQPTRHDDHICRPDPPVPLPPRWAIAPRRLEPSVIWLAHKMSGLAASVDDALRFRRTMALASPQAEVSELVDKRLLSVDPDLLRQAEARGHAPVRPPPRPEPEIRPASQAPSGRTVIVTCMKNEGPFILEWVAYHRMIGVDDILVYTNDCDDGTDALLDLLAARGLVQRRDNLFRATGSKPQHAALTAAASEPVVQAAGWLVSMDVDEFINIHVGARRLPDLYAAVADADLVSMTWRLFGNCDLHRFEDRPVTAQFTRCAPQMIRRPHQAWGFKTLFRNRGQFAGLGVHRPRGYQGGAPRWVNGSGQPMPDRYRKSGWRSDMQSVGYGLVTLNHYAVRSVDSFLVKRDRGRVNHVARDQGAAYWFRMNNNAVEDRSIQHHSDALAATQAALLRDPELRAAHDACVAAHRAKIAALLTDPAFARLSAELSSDRMQALSRLHHHFGMNVFLSGPAVIPDRLLQQDLPETFFFNVPPPQGPAAG